MIIENNDITNPSLKLIIIKMFEYAEIPFDMKIINENNWFHNNTWTYSQSEKFHKWFNELLYNDKQVRRDIMSYPRKTKIAIEKTYQWFNLMYGLRIKN